MEPAKGPMAWKNRQNPNIYGVFANIMRRKDLWVSVDRYGSMRPTKNVPKGRLENTKITVEVTSATSETIDHPEWKTMAIWTHWDLNPCTSIICICNSKQVIRGLGVRSLSWQCIQFYRLHYRKQWLQMGWRLEATRNSDTC
jgi:hypothetical protein